MSAEQLLKNGDITGALSALKQEIRANASDAKKRTFLFQLFAVTGDWQKALDQLNVVGELDALALPMVQSYRETIACEALRKEIFSGGRSPLIMGKPEEWVALLTQSLALLSMQNVQQAESIRDKAFEGAPTTSGTINGQPFEWIADADSRLGPVLEVIVNGKYYWVPFNQIQKIEIEAPTDLRDAVWLPGNFRWSSGGETVGFIPTRYVDSESSEDDAVKLSRKTVWEELSPNTVIGRGQRMLTTDEAEYAMLDVREIVFNLEPTTDDAAQAESTNG